MFQEHCGRPKFDQLTPGNYRIVGQNRGIPAEAGRNRPDLLWHIDFHRNLVDTFGVRFSRWEIPELPRVHVLVHSSLVNVAIQRQEQGMGITSVDCNDFSLVLWQERSLWHLHCQMQIFVRDFTAQGIIVVTSPSINLTVVRQGRRVESTGGYLNDIAGHVTGQSRFILGWLLFVLIYDLRRDAQL